MKSLVKGCLFLLIAILHLMLITLSSCNNKKLQSTTETNSFNVDIEIPINREEIIEFIKKSEVKSLNINDLFEISIPESMKIISIDQYLFMDRESTQYSISNYLGMVYLNKYFVIEIDCYGDSDMAILNGNETYNLRKIINPDPYKSRNVINYLKENYSDDSFVNKNGVKIGKSITSWASWVSSDYYGLYFTLSDDKFNECVISIYDVWYSFAKNERLVHNDKDYKEKYKNEGGNLEKIFHDLELLENSITFKISNDSIKILNGEIGENIIDDRLVFPTIDNLRMRNSPSLTGEILGYMEKIIYRVIIIGDNDEIDGINGNWVMVIPYNGNNVSWVFNGFTRKPTEDELWRFFGG